jgi:hypothetical protein
MKSKFYLLLLAPLFILASCSKTRLDSPANVVGNWQLQSVERQGQLINTGYEYGEFYFRSNGSAQYVDDIGEMNGSWQMVSHPEGNSLELRLYDYYSNSAIEWEFYSIELSSGGSRMIGYMNKYGYEYRYVFGR